MNDENKIVTEINEFRLTETGKLNDDYDIHVESTGTFGYYGSIHTVNYKLIYTMLQEIKELRNKLKIYEA